MQPEDKKHAVERAAEQKALFKDFSADDKTGGNYNGYNKLYKDLVDQDKDSYRRSEAPTVPFIMTNSGKVIYIRLFQTYHFR